MDPLAELKLHVDALTTAVKANPKFFASVIHYMEQLRESLSQGGSPLTYEELKILTDKIEEFWAKWRPSGGGLYIPPRETSDTDKTVKRMNVLIGDMAALDTASFEELVSRLIGQ